MEFVITHLKETGSTNDDARALAAKGAKEGSVIRADIQTKGKGRSGRSWQSDTADNLYFSLILKPEYDLSKASMVTLVMALAVNNALRSLTAKETMIKWPNDIVLSGKKICGILTELFVTENNPPALVVGVGINVSKKEFAVDIKDTATSLFLETGVEYNIEEILDSILKEFDSLYDKFVKDLSLSFMKEQYEKTLANMGKGVKVLDPKEPFEGVAKGITDSGELLVLADNEIKTVYAGEVSVRGIYGYV